MADDEQSTSGMVSGLVQDFISQLRTVTEGLEDLAGFGARRPLAPGTFALPGALICEAPSPVKGPTWSAGGFGDWSSPCFLIGAGHRGGRHGVKVERPAGRTTLTPGRPPRTIARRGSKGPPDAVKSWGMRLRPAVDVCAASASSPGRAGRPALSRCAEHSSWLRRHDA